MPSIDVTAEDLLLAVSAATFAAAFIGAVYSILSYRLRKKIDLRGSYSLVSSVASEEKYIGSITLENLTERPVVIFKIFLEVDYGYYIEIENFEDDPLILKGFRAIKRTYDPIDFYSVGTQQMRMSNLLGEDGVRHRIVLATSQGRYDVEGSIQRWSPRIDFFNNHLTAIVQPMRTTYEGEAYGSEVKYIVRLEWDDREDEIIPIYPHDHSIRKFRSFELTPEALKSKEALETFLLEQAVDGSLMCKEISVVDAKKWRDEAYKRHWDEEVEAVPRGWLVYHVVGFFVTRWDNVKLKWKNWRN